MIWKDGGEIEGLWKNGERLAAVWKAGELVWEGLRSCFGSGLWRGDKPWRDDDGWRS